MLQYYSSTSQTINFNPPINDPVAQILYQGVSGRNMGGPWDFNVPFEVLNVGKDAAFTSSTQIIENAEPNQGGATHFLLRFPGINSSIS